MSAPQKIVSLGFIELDKVESNLDSTLREYEEARARAREWAAAMHTVTLIEQYNAAETSMDLSEWVLQDANGVILPWISDRLRKKLETVYRPVDSLTISGWPLRQIAEDINRQLEGLSGIPLEEGGLGRGIRDVKVIVGAFALSIMFVRKH